MAGGIAGSDDGVSKAARTRQLYNQRKHHRTKAKKNRFEEFAAWVVGTFGEGRLYGGRGCLDQCTTVFDTKGAAVAHGCYLKCTSECVRGCDGGDSDVESVAKRAAARALLAPPAALEVYGGDASAIARTLLARLSAARYTMSSTREFHDVEPAGRA